MLTAAAGDAKDSNGDEESDRDDRALRAGHVEVAHGVNPVFVLTHLCPYRVALVGPGGVYKVMHLSIVHPDFPALHSLRPPSPYASSLRRARAHYSN